MYINLKEEEKNFKWLEEKAIEIKKESNKNFNLYLYIVFVSFFLLLFTKEYLIFFLFLSFISTYVFILMNSTFKKYQFSKSKIKNVELIKQTGFNIEFFDGHLLSNNFLKKLYIEIKTTKNKSNFTYLNNVCKNSLTNGYVNIEFLYFVFHLIKSTDDRNKRFLFNQIENLKTSYDFKKDKAIEFLNKKIN